MAQGGSARLRVFISYRHEDVPDATDRLTSALKAYFGAESVFADVADIDIGTDIADSIETVVAGCDVVLAVMGRRWSVDDHGRRRLDNPDDWVRRELEAALASRHTRVVPVLMYGAQLPSPDDLPERLRPLLRLRAFEIPRQLFDAAVGELITSLDKVAGERGGRGELAASPIRELARTALEWVRFDSPELDVLASVIQPGETLINLAQGNRGWRHVRSRGIFALTDRRLLFVSGSGRSEGSRAEWSLDSLTEPARRTGTGATVKTGIGGERIILGSLSPRERAQEFANQINSLRGGRH
jgi:hypothetical protein